MRRGLRTGRRYSASAECEARVEKRKLRLPPSALRRNKTAIASSSVDFPAPFSPIRKVTGRSKRNWSSSRIAGILKGYSSKDGTRSRSSPSPTKKLRARYAAVECSSLSAKFLSQQLVDEGRVGLAARRLHDL